MPLVDGLGVTEPEAVGDGVALGTGVADPAPLTRTWRKRSSAVCWTVARMFLSCLPGIEMTMLLPAVVTSDSATPKLSTRFRMMETAWLSESFGTEPEPVVRRGVRMTLVPPSRSRPSRGWYFCASVSCSLPIESGAAKKMAP